MCDRIVELLPPHVCYVEVFAGGASVLLSKAPATLDVYNDLDDGLVNFFTCLRDRADALVPLLELTPHSRREWEKCRDGWWRVKDDVERARQWYVVAQGSFGAIVGRGTGAGWKFERGRGWAGEKAGRMHLSRAASNANRVDHIWRFVERLRLVQIDCLDWRECIQRYDGPDTAFYLDPPYVPTTRRGGHYQHELTEDDHRELVSVALELEGSCVISGYDHAVYDLLEENGWTKIRYGVWSTAGQRTAGRDRDRRVEVLWASPSSASPRLFDEWEVK